MSVGRTFLAGVCLQRTTSSFPLYKMLGGWRRFFVQRKTTFSTLKATCHELSCLLPHLVQTSFLAKGRFAAGGSAPPTRPSAPLFLDVLSPCPSPSASLARPLPPGLGPALPLASSFVAFSQFLVDELPPRRPLLGTPPSNTRKNAQIYSANRTRRYVLFVCR